MKRTTPTPPTFTPASGGALGTSVLHARRDGDRLLLSISPDGKRQEAEVTRAALGIWNDRVKELVAFVRSRVGEVGAELRTPYLLSHDSRPLVALRCTVLADGPSFLLSCATRAGAVPVEAPLELAQVTALIADVDAFANAR